MKTGIVLQSITWILTATLSQIALATQRLPEAPEDSDYYFNGSQAPAKVKLGQLLFFDKILSGNENISCATCHHSLTGTGDGLSLPSGEGALGLGVTRDTGSGADTIHERVPRNAPPVFNLGAKEFVAMFHDGRVAVDAEQPSGFASPAGANLPMNLDNVLAAQAMFPVTSATEMAGQLGENPQADLAAAGNLPGVWALLAAKLQAIPEYVDLFKAAFSDVTSASDITYVHAANAISAFEAVAWRFDNSPFDEYLRGANGSDSPLAPRARKGAMLFYGKAECSTCHMGKFQTDHQFHAIAMPQVGPGKGDGDAGNEDFGRERVTGLAEDRYRFRTPTLRNVALTPPYGHDGAFNTLRGMVEHHLNTLNSLFSYDVEQIVVPSSPTLDAIDRSAMANQAIVSNIATANELAPIELNEQEIQQILAFLYALSDPSALDLRNAVPQRVPSGLAIFD